MRPYILLASGVIGLTAAGAGLAGPEKVSFPADYADRFVKYSQVDRPDRQIVRFLYVNPEALEAAEPAEPLPYGTVLVMEDHKARLDTDGNAVTGPGGRLVPTEELTNVFVMEKQPGWGAEYPPEQRNGEWEYAWFLPDGARKADAAFDGCFACHAAQAGQDYTFTFAQHVMDTKK